jgi:glycosyltransferase involved in cell wall biosynthesis
MKAEIDKMISEYGLEEYFILEGIRENPYPYMKKADLIVQPSRFEGKSIVLDEAKILGKAIVVTNYPSVKDQISNLYNGVITDISPVAIADGVERLLKDSEIRMSIETNNYMEVNKSRHSIETFYEMIHF